MDTQKGNFQHDMKVEIHEASLLNCENKGKGITKPNNQKSSSECNGKQVQEEYLVSKTIKQEEIDIKSEEVEGVHFNTDEISEKQIQDYDFDSKSIKQEKIEIKTENEEGDNLSFESSAFEYEKVLHPSNKTAHASDCFRINTNLKEPPVFKCLKCNHQTHKKQNIKYHVLTHMPKSFKCSLCSYKSYNRHLLSRHKKLHECTKQALTTTCRRIRTKKLLIHKPDEITWYQCSKCQYKTKVKNTFEMHVSSHMNDRLVYKSTLPSYESFGKDALQLQLNEDLPLISCPEEECSFKTHVQDDFQRHIRSVHKYQRMLKCSKCPFESKYLTSFKAHLVQHENLDQWYSCPLCPLKTSRRSYLSKHSLVHERDSEIKCKTKLQFSLTKYRQKHGSDWFYCYVCTFRTLYKHSLSNHIRHKHRDADGRICLH